MNKVILMGRLCIEPEKNQAGTATRIRLAVPRPKNKNGEVITDYINCFVFGDTQPFVQKWFHKGDPIIVQGNISVNQYTAQDGSKRESVSVAVDKVEFVMRNNENRDAGAPVPNVPVPNAQGFTPVNDDDLPF